MGVEERSFFFFFWEGGSSSLGGSQDSIIAPTGSGEGRVRDCRDEEASVKENHRRKGRDGREVKEWKKGVVGGSMDETELD